MNFVNDDMSANDVSVNKLFVGTDLSLKDISVNNLYVNMDMSQDGSVSVCILIRI